MQLRVRLVVVASLAAMVGCKRPDAVVAWSRCAQAEPDPAYELSAVTPFDGGPEQRIDLDDAGCRTLVTWQDGGTTFTQVSRVVGTREGRPDLRIQRTERYNPASYLEQLDVDGDGHIDREKHTTFFLDGGWQASVQTDWSEPGVPSARNRRERLEEDQVRVTAEQWVDGGWIVIDSFENPIQRR